jgi:hypothetical protein
MEIDGNGNSVEPYSEPPPSDPPPSSDSPSEPSYYPPPQDTVESTSASSESRDESAEAWAAGTIAAAEQYVIDNPPPNEFGWKPAEERAQDAFWEHDPNRPTSSSAPPSQPTQPEPEGSDLDPKNPMNKPEEPPSDPNAPGPDLSTGQGPVPPHLLPKPPPPTNPAFDFGPPPPPLPPTGNAFIDLVTWGLNFPVRPTHSTTQGGTNIFGVSSNPPPKPPEPIDPTTKSNVPTEP